MLRPYGLWSFPSGMMDSNTEGFRIDPSITVEPPLDKTRVAILGGSVVWGQGVGRDQTIAYYLERALTKQRPNGFEVLNFGISGYTSSNELVLLAQKVIRYRPDHVVIFDGWNDFTTRRFIPHYGHILAKYKTVLDQANYGVSSLRMSLNNVLFSTYSGRILSYLFGNRAQGDEFIEQARAAVEQDMARSVFLPDEQWTNSIYRDNLISMAGILHGFGIPGTFVFQPYNRLVFEQEKRDAEVYLAFESAFFSACEASKSVCFSLLEIFRASDVESESFLDNVHFSEFGNDLVGQVIAELIKDRFQPIHSPQRAQVARVLLCRKPATNDTEIPYLLVSHETC